MTTTPPTLRLFGPPGTGKTASLSRRVVKTVRERGADAIGIVSFSNAAAEEIGDRDGVRGVLPKGAVGTLHSRAYRAIGHPPLALDPKVLAGWNAQAGPHWQVSGDARGLETRDRAGAGMAECGDGLLEQLDVLRARQAHPRTWPPPVRAFARAWTAWKRSADDAVDFTDMIVLAYRLAVGGAPIPGNPSVLVVDEAQDTTPIETALIMAWGAQLGPDGHLVFALDDDQAIYDWRGGNPYAILDLRDADDEVLAQSYRVPPAVHAVAEAWISRCATRYPKAYRPRVRVEADADAADAYGHAYRVGYGLGEVAELADVIEADLAADDHSTSMVLASCGYMLTPLLGELRRRGVPFHNPFRPTEGAWNPLGKPGRGIGTPERIARYLALAERDWTGEDVRAWTALVAVADAGLAHGVRKAIEALPTGTVPYPLIEALWRDDDVGNAALVAALGPDLDWLASVIVGSRRKVARYPLRVARERGAPALLDPPRLIVGTIHSAKGGEADRVYLAPDLSAAGLRQWQSGAAGRDQTVRLFYVGITRAFRELRILAPASKQTVPLEQLLPAALEVRA